MHSGIKINILSRHEVPQAVEHPRDNEKPPGTPSGRRLRLEIAPSPVERLFPPSGGVSRGSVRVGGETFLLPSYGFSFGYKRKGVSFAMPTEARRKNLCTEREPQLSPPRAGCPHPSRCSAKAQHRATFPLGKAKAAEPRLVWRGRLRRTAQIRCDTHFPHFAIEDRIRKRRFYETSCFDDT